MNTTFISKIEAIIARMSPTSLQEMEHVKLMRRTDTKFVVDAERLPDLLEQISDSYKVLMIKGKALQAYKTVYYDTSRYTMYHEHHNQRKNRYKVRQRQYLNSGEQYLEVKFKNNKGETIKSRQRTTPNLEDLDNEDALFLPEYSPYQKEQLSPVLNNHFQRLTLVSKHDAERLTIDLDLQFEYARDHTNASFAHLVIIEVKRERDNKHSEIINILQKERIKASGFSKYCMGLAVTNDKVKYQLFKPRLRRYQLWNIKNNIN